MIDLVNSTIKSSWPMLVLFLVIYFVFKIFSLKNSRKRIQIFEEVYFVLFIVYIYLLVSIVSYGELNVSSGVNLMPFKEILRYELFGELFMMNVIGNMILYMPLGYFIGYFIKTKKTFLVMCITVFISLAGELLQTYIGRCFDIDDIILNTLGAVIGFLVYKFLYKMYRKLPNCFQKDGLYNVLCIIIITVIVLYVLNVIGVFSIW